MHIKEDGEEPAGVFDGTREEKLGGNMKDMRDGNQVKGVISAQPGGHCISVHTSYTVLFRSQSVG